MTYDVLIPYANDRVFFVDVSPINGNFDIVYFVTEEVNTWLGDNGKSGWSTEYNYIPWQAFADRPIEEYDKVRGLIFKFGSADEAMRFKLTWA